MKLRNILSTLKGLQTVSPGKLHEMITNNRVTVLDVNARRSWRKSRVPGALNLNPEGYTKSDLPTYKSLPLVFYCSNPMCRKAPNAARRAENMGYDNVKVMSSGINGWLSAGLPTEDGK